MNSFEARKQARIDRYRRYAERAGARSDAAYSRFRSINAAIPMGQPILIGHHSERRHRTDIKRMDNAVRASVEESKKADYWSDRAAAAESNHSIDTRDPRALELLKQKLALYERNQESMKLANKALRSGDFTALRARGFSEQAIEELKKPDVFGRVGFPDYRLKNNGAEIRRIKKRIAKLGILAERPETEESVGTVVVRENAEENRIEIAFPAKPSAELISDLKRNGWKWSRYSGAWVRQGRSDWQLQCAREFAKRYESVQVGGAA